SVIAQTIEETLPVTPELPKAAMLRYWTQVVEAAKLPIEQQQDAIERLEANRVHWLNEPLDFSHSNMANAFHRGQALLSCAIVMLAAERFRQERSAWPTSIAELCPAYLKAVPKDPFDGNALRYKRLADSVVIYSIAKKRSDAGGKLFRPGKGLMPD